MDLAAEWGELLHAEAAGYAEVAIANLKREFPSDVHQTMAGPGDFPFRPRARTPVFYGSLDWHSAVEMHWLLVRLLRTAGDDVPAPLIRKAAGPVHPVALAGGGLHPGLAGPVAALRLGQPALVHGPGSG